MTKRKKITPVKRVASVPKIVPPSSKVRKSNIFIDGRYRFGLLEQKILLQILSKVGMDEKEFSPYFVSWSELLTLGKDNLNTLKKIDASCEKLKNKTIKIKNGKTEDNFGFLSGWTITPGHGVFFRIDPGMKSMLLDLLGTGNFTLFDLQCAISLSSSHSIRLYEILKSHQWKAQPVTLTLDEIKYALDIDKDSPTYSNFSNFRSRILLPSQKAFKEHTDIVFTFSTVKAGRKVVSLEVTIKKNFRYQKTIQGECAKQETVNLVSGDIILLGDKEYTFADGGLLMGDGALPTGDVMRLIKEGKAVVRKNKN